MSQNHQSCNLVRVSPKVITCKVWEQTSLSAIETLDLLIRYGTVGARKTLCADRARVNTPADAAEFYEVQPSK